MAKVWLTRPVADSKALAQELAAQHIASIVAPVMHITHKPFTAPSIRPDALLLTSRHANHALAQLPAEWRALPVYCVGGATAHIASDLGFTHVIPGSSDILTLLPRMTSSVKPGSEVLYLAGEDVSIDVAALLTAHSIKISTHVTYRAVAEERISDVLREALVAGEVTAVSFFSTRSAEITQRLLTQAGLQHLAPKIEAFCISLQVANAAGSLPWAKLHACHVPTGAAMRDLMVSHIPKTL